MITVAFITCVNNQALYETCLAYLGQLNTQGFSVEYIPLYGRTSMTLAYNEAMRRSQAMYKVYLHQDTFINEPLFLHHIHNIFLSDPSIGMIGMLGGKKMPGDQDKLTWLWDCPEIYGNIFVPKVNQSVGGPLKNGPYQWVTVIDGCLMATRYDVPWRDDIFDGFHFYDLSQSLEFWKKNYKVVVPTQVTPWVSHLCFQTFDSGFYRLREKFLSEYRQYLSTNVKRVGNTSTIVHKGKRYKFTL